MKTIHQYTFAAGTAPELMIPAGSETLSLFLDSDIISLSMLSDIGESPEPRQVFVARAGDEVPDDSYYLGTVVSGNEAIHYFLL